MNGGSARKSTSHRPPIATRRRSSRPRGRGTAPPVGHYRPDGNGGQTETLSGTKDKDIMARETDTTARDGGQNRRTFLAGTGMMVSGGALLGHAPYGQLNGPVGRLLHDTGAREHDAFELRLHVQVSERESLGEMAVFGIDWQVSVPFDEARGVISGRRRHTPLVVSKPLHPSTPRLYEVMTNGETLAAATVSAYDTSGGRTGGAPVYAVVMENSNIVSIDTHGAGLTETVGFLYDTITVDHRDGGRHTDSWAGTA